MTEENLTEYEVTYTGRRHDTDGKIVWVYHDERDGSRAIYSKPLVQGGRPGATYRVHARESGSVLIRGPHAPRYVRSLPHDDPSVIAWAAADLAVEVERQRQSAIRKAGDPFEEVVQLVRRASFDLTRQQKRVLAVRLMEAMGL